MTAVDDNVSVEPTNSGINKKRGGRLPFRSKKGADGTVRHFPIFGKKERRFVGPDKRAYTNAYSQQKASYLQNQFASDMLQYQNSLATILNGEQTGINEYQLMLSYLTGMHQTILKGMNLETYHDLLLGNRNVENYLIKKLGTIRDDKGNLIRIDNMAVFDGSGISGMVNLRINGNGNDKDGNTLRIAKLEVIPITDRIFMSLSSKGGFYYREGKVLIPFDRLTEEGFLTEGKILGNPQFLSTVKEKVKEFNQEIDLIDASGVAIPGDSSAIENPQLAGYDPDAGDIKQFLKLINIGDSNGNQGGEDKPPNNPQSQGSQGKDRKDVKDEKYNKHLDWDFVSKFFNIDGYSPELPEAISKSEPLLGTVMRNNLVYYDKDSKKLKFGKLDSGLKVYSLIYGDSEENLLKTLANVEPDEDEKPYRDNIIDFVQYFSTDDGKEQVAKNLIGAFKRANKLTKATNIPDDPLEFEKYINADNGESNIVKPLWDNFISPKTQSQQARLTNAYEKVLEEDSDTDLGSDQRVSATGYAGLNTKGSTSSSTGLSNFRKKPIDWTKPDKNGNYSSPFSKSNSSEQPRVVSPIKSIIGNTAKDKGSGMGYNGKYGDTLKKEAENFVRERKAPRTDSRARFITNVNTEDASTINRALKETLDKIYEYGVTDRDFPETRLVQFLSDYIATGNMSLSPYYNPDNTDVDLDGDEILGDFFSKLTGGQQLKDGNL